MDLVSSFKDQLNHCHNNNWAPQGRALTPYKQRKSMWLRQFLVSEYGMFAQIMTMQIRFWEESLFLIYKLSLSIDITVKDRMVWRKINRLEHQFKEIEK